jgi:predicted dehydrogenase
MDRVQVGLIGANSERGWSARSHLPALEALDGLELAAVATSRMDTARATADRYHARRAYDDADELIADPEVELVVVTVRVANHYALVRAALEAGKDVLCEWPLACGTADATDLLGRAERLGRRHFIGLQASVAPEVRIARRMIGDGDIGQVRAVTVRAAAATGGTPFPADGRYLLEPEVRTSLLSIQVAHTLAGVTRLVGPLVAASGLNRTRYPRVRLSETGERVDAPFPDHTAIVAATVDDVLISVNVATGVPGNPGTVVEVTGSTGTLRLESAGPLQYTDLRLLASAPGRPPEQIAVSAPYRRAPAHLTDRAAIGVAELYLAVADDLRGSGPAAPTFADAVATHRLLDDTGLTAAST